MGKHSGIEGYIRDEYGDAYWNLNKDKIIKNIAKDSSTQIKVTMNAKARRALKRQLEFGQIVDGTIRQYMTKQSRLIEIFQRFPDMKSRLISERFHINHNTVRGRRSEFNRGLPE